MVKVYVCPDHEKPRGTCKSWDENGVVKSPDAGLEACFKILQVDDGVYLVQEDGRHFALTWKGRISGVGDTFKVSQDDFRECEVPDCCQLGNSAKEEGKA